MRKPNILADGDEVGHILALQQKANLYNSIYIGIYAYSFDSPQSLSSLCRMWSIIAMELTSEEIWGEERCALDSDTKYYYASRINDSPKP